MGRIFGQRFPIVLDGAPDGGFQSRDRPDFAEQELAGVAAPARCLAGWLESQRRMAANMVRQRRVERGQAGKSVRRLDPGGTDQAVEIGNEPEPFGFTHLAQGYHLQRDGGGIGRAERLAIIAGAHRGRQVAPHVLRGRKIVQQAHGIRTRLQRPVIGRQDLVDPAHGLQRDGQVGERLGVIRRDLQRVPEGRDRLFHAPCRL